MKRLVIVGSFSLLGLGLPGCGLYHALVYDGSVEPTPGGEREAAATPRQPPPAKLPVREVRLPNTMTEPAVLESGYTGTHKVPVKIVTTTPRTISVVVLGGQAFQGRFGDERIDSVKITPEQPLEFEVQSVQGDDPRPWHVVVRDDQQTRFTVKTMIYGHPRAGATLRERVLDDYSVLLAGVPLVGGRDALRSPELFVELFTSIDERFFVWTKKERQCDHATGPLRLGEPLLLLVISPHGVHLQRANGEQAMCLVDDDDIDLVLTTERPAKVVMPPAVALAKSPTFNLWDDEEFLPLAAQTPRIAAYKEHKARVGECYDREWDKHDPDGKADDYDAVEYDENGTIERVESMSERILRKVTKACNVTALEMEREAIRAELRVEGEARSAASLAVVAAHFAKE